MLDLGIDKASKKRIRKLFPSRQAAKSWLETKQDAKATVAAETVLGPRVAEAYNRWVKRVEADGRARSTWSTYAQRANNHAILARVKLDKDGEERVFGELRVAEVTTTACVLFKAALQAKGLSPAMVGKVMSDLRMMLNDCILQGDLKSNPGTPVKTKRGERHKRKVEIPTPAEMRGILEIVNAAGIARPTRGQVFVNFQPRTGLRPSETLALAWSHIALEAHQPFVRVERAIDAWGNFGPPKSAAGYRDVPLPADLVEILLAWRKVCPKSEHGLVFPTSEGHPDSQSNLRARVWLPLMQAAGLAIPLDKPLRASMRSAARNQRAGTETLWSLRYTVYAMRHFYASALIIAQGLVPKKVQEMLGHDSIQVTMDTYGHLWADPQGDATVAKHLAAFLAA